MHDRPARPTVFCWNQNHPRICGEKRIKNRDRGQYRGSPPHMQGKVGTNGGCNQIVGITPAYAGKRFSCKSGEKQVGDHPRVCGEKGTWLNPASLFRGSPPRMRGKVAALHLGDGEDGITPAYAGKRAHGCICERYSWDHPRVCGEKCGTLSGSRCRTGSPPRMRGKGQCPLHRTTEAWDPPPPRMRGKVNDGVHDELRFRITPAYAGKSVQ